MKDRFEHFTFLISKIYRDIQKIKSVELKKYGLNGRHMMCLHFLGTNEDGLSFKELCQLCDEDKSQVSRSLTYLRKEGIIEYVGDGSKKYKEKIRLSDKGRIAFESIDKITLDICERVYLNKDKYALDTFYQNLEQVSERISSVLEGEKKI